MADRSEMPESVGRRRTLRALGGLAVLTIVEGCRERAISESNDPGGTSVPLSAIREGGRMVVRVHGKPVELRREDGQVRARSLVCTHFGCSVRWEENLRQYHCPCHDGRFDEHGRPVQGPPPKPLADVPVRVEADVAVLG